MNFKECSEKEKKDLSNLMFQPLNSAEELKNWIMFFYGIDLPIGCMDPDSNSSPVDAMWEIYDNIRMNKGDEQPGYIMLSAREAYKTLSASILETLLMIHFEVTIAHMAAIQSQSAKAIQYINYFFAKIQPLLVSAGWEKEDQNKGKIQYRTPGGEYVYIKVIIATLSGANSEHTTMLFFDEIDVVKDVLALEESKLIPGYTKGRYPLTVKLSTRKFAFGLMQKEIDLAPISGDKILRWNILDVTERCPETRHKPLLPKVDVYVNRSLPLRDITVEEYTALPEAEKARWELVPQAHGGCVGCRLLPVCKTRLSSRPLEATGGLYKPISAVINTFKKTNPDMAEAQLMCWRPSSKGLVYPRFENVMDSGNVISVDSAFKILLGDDPVGLCKEKGILIPKRKLNADDLLNVMKNLKIDFFAGVDWGYTHDFVIVIFTKIPNGQFWVVDCYSASGLEFSDCLEVAKEYRDKYQPMKWFADTAMPSHIKSFSKNGMKCPSFTKDVMGGIEALRSKIVDGSNRRMLKVLKIEQCEKVISAFQKHHFKLDTAGNPTIQPDDTPGTSDQADAMRYVGQNLFPVRGTQKPHAVWTETEKPVNYNPTHNQQMMEEIAKHVTQPTDVKGGTTKRGGFFFTS